MREWIWHVDGRIGSTRNGQAGREEIRGETGFGLVVD